jgi:hypothetical protein
MCVQPYPHFGYYQYGTDHLIGGHLGRFGRCEQEGENCLADGQNQSRFLGRKACIIFVCVVTAPIILMSKLYIYIYYNGGSITAIF